MLELEPPAEHRVPIDAAEGLAAFLVEAQPSSGVHPVWGHVVEAWQQLIRYDEQAGITPNAPQVTRLLVRASQIALTETTELVQQQALDNQDVGTRVAHLFANKKTSRPDVLLVMPDVFVDLPPDISKYIATYFEPN